MNTTNTVKYIKSFSKGQITIPKDFRDFLGMDHEFWLKLYIDHGRIIAEPMQSKVDKKSKETYRKTLRSIKVTLDLEPEIMKNRKQIEERLQKTGL